MSKSSTIRVSFESKKKLKTIADKTGKPMQEVLNKAIEDFRRKLFLEEANRSYQILKDNKRNGKMNKKKGTFGMPLFMTD